MSYHFHHRGDQVCVRKVGRGRACGAHPSDQKRLSSLASLVKVLVTVLELELDVSDEASTRSW